MKKTKKQAHFLRCDWCEKMIKAQRNNTHYSSWYDFPQRYGILSHIKRGFEARDIYIYCAACNKTTKHEERREKE